MKVKMQVTKYYCDRCRSECKREDLLHFDMIVESAENRECRSMNYFSPYLDRKELPKFHVPFLVNTMKSICPSCAHLLKECIDSYMQDAVTSSDIA